MSRVDFCDCGYKHVNEIEKKVFKQIHNISINEELIRSEIEKEVSTSKNGNSQVESQMARSKKELKGIESALNRWYDAFEHGALDPAELAERVQQLKEKRNRLEEHIEILRGKLREKKQQSIHAENVITQIRNFNKIWSESKYDERKEIIQGLVKKVEVYKNDETRVEFDL
ncbi:MAG: hypothetical protein FH756_20115 [Firmicutes bacterium]|nr:hypothetical protein [Bacillota bacterium]